MKHLVGLAILIALAPARAGAAPILVNVFAASHTAQATLEVMPVCDPPCTESITDGGEISGVLPQHITTGLFSYYASANAGLFEASAFNHTPIYGYPDAYGGLTEASAETVLRFSPVVDSVAPITLTLQKGDTWGYSEASIYAQASASFFDVTANQALPCGWTWNYLENHSQGSGVSATATCLLTLTASHVYQLSLSAHSWSGDGWSAASVNVSGLEAVPGTQPGPLSTVPEPSTLACLSIGLAGLFLARKR